MVMNRAVIVIFLAVFLITSCTITQHQNYQDEFPQPCSSRWFVEVEREVNLVNAETGRPPPGSPQWLAALDEKYSISKNTSTEVGDIEWCHQVHQQFIGL